jgi:hypothetical protein
LHATANINALSRFVFENVSSGPGSRQDIRISSNAGGTGSNLFIGTADNAYGQGEKAYIDSVGQLILLNGSVKILGTASATGTLGIVRNTAGGYVMTLSSVSPAYSYGIGIEATTGDLVLDDLTAGARRLTLETTGTVSLTGLISAPEYLGSAAQSFAACLYAPQDLGVVSNQPTQSLAFSWNSTAHALFFSYVDAGGTYRIGSIPTN